MSLRGQEERREGSAVSALAFIPKLNFQHLGKTGEPAYASERSEPRRACGLLVSEAQAQGQLLVCRLSCATSADGREACEC